MIKRILKALLILVFSLCLITGVLIYRLLHPEQVIYEFRQHLVAGRFEQAYECLSWKGKERTGKHEFITKISSLLPFEIPEDVRPETFIRMAKIVEVDVAKKSPFTSPQYVDLRIAFPSQRAIDRIVDRFETFQLRRANLDSLISSGIKKELTYQIASRYVIDILDSLDTLGDKEMFQYFEVEEIRLEMEFEFWRWKITGEM